MPFFCKTKQKKKSFFEKNYNAKKIKKKVKIDKNNFNKKYYIGETTNTKPHLSNNSVQIGINDLKSKFTKKFDVSNDKQTLHIDNLQGEYYDANVIHIKRKKNIQEKEIKKLVNFDKNGNLITTKKHSKLTYKDIHKIVKFALQEMYYAEYIKNNNLIIPIDPLYYQTLKDGGRMNITKTFHPCGLKDKNGEPVMPKTFQQKLVRYIINSMRYMHPYPYTDTSTATRKVYIYKDDIRVIDRKFLSQAIDMSKNQEDNFKPCCDLIMSCIKNAEKQNKNSVVALPISITNAQHAILFTCFYDRNKNKISIRVINSNNNPNGYKEYGLPIFNAFKKLLPYYINHDVKFEAKYLELYNQVGPTCMQYGEQEARNVVKKNSIGIANRNEIIHGALQRAAEYELCKKLGVKIGINDIEVKNVTDQIKQQDTINITQNKQQLPQQIQKETNNKKSNSSIKKYISSQCQASI